MQNRVMQHGSEKVRNTTRSHLARALLICAVLVCGHVNAQLPETSRTLQQLTDQRLVLTAELDQEAENVERLHNLLENYEVELQESARISLASEEIARRELAQHEAETLNKTPFSVDKVRLTGSEASTALAHISQRLVDPRIPESRRDIAPICNIKTRLLKTLISVENRSLKPVGKNHYIARVRLQPGETTISILSDQWEVDLPQHANAQDFLITLYRPQEGTTELHVFAVDDLLATGGAHIPVWLPDELDIKTQAG
jgi:hypothetical protein